MSSNDKSIGTAIKKRKIRFDLEIISDLVQENSKVLDIGCGDGELLQYLKKIKKINGRGLEISQKAASRAVSKGISVIQGDAEKDLVDYPDSSFDYVILSQTIQAMHNPKEVMEQMLRIADFAIVSLPNFSYFRNRFYLLLKGQMPVSETIPYQWYDTPNIHFCSIKDFEQLCSDMGFDVIGKVFLTNRSKLSGPIGGGLFANFFAEYGIFLITKNELAGITQSEEVSNGRGLFSLKQSEVGLARNTN